MENQKSSRWLTTFLIVMAKSKYIAVAAKTVKMMKVAKPLVTVITVLLSVLAYGWAYGSWYFAAGLVIMILIHEFGHVIAIRQQGLPPAPMVFIPFLGAAIFVPPLKTRHTEAVVGIGGPLLGTAGAVAAFALWAILPGEHPMLLLTSYVGMVLNLFNMIPLSPLDGGRITQICGPWFKAVGFIALFAFTLMAAQPALLLIWILVLDGFDRMPGHTRPIIASILLVTMSGLMLAGFGHQPWWLDCIDIVLALSFTAGFYFRARNPGLFTPQTYEDERTITSQDRTRWAAAWIALVIFLSGMMVVQIPFMPKEIKQSIEASEQQ